MHRGLAGVDYLRGWKMGWGVITLYPLAWALIFLPYFFLHGLVSFAVAQSWRNMGESVGAIALVVAIARMIWVLRVLSKS